MENKYYTPAIEEFHVGFEYEQNYDIVLTAQELAERESTWDTKVFEVKDYEFIEHLVKTEYVRVKHLDRKDIENLGWIMDARTVDYMYFYLKANPAVELFLRLPYIMIRNNARTVFEGKLKNKSELKTLMKWVQIT